MRAAYSPAVNELPERLKKWRSDKRLSQSGAASLVGATQSTWSRWEKGSKPSAVALVAILRTIDGKE
jgi:transcriptional regulator with XRE-family HTH domain